MKAFAKALDPASPSGKAYRALMDRPPSYKWASDEQKEYAGEVTTDLQALAAKWANRAGKTPVDLEVGAPRPTPDLRVVPKV